MKYWFKRRRYGYGFVPVTSQGWLLVVCFIATVVIGTVLILATHRSVSAMRFFAYILFLITAIAIFISISIHKGPKPKWRWGKSETDNPDEDW